MTARLAKELRPLMFPWIVTMVTAVGYRNSDFDGLGGLVPWVFAFGCLALATLPFGSEFQNRTLGLMLSQPVERDQLWRDKVMAAILAIGSAAVVHGVAYGLLSRPLEYPRFSNQPLSVLFIIATICSGGVLTLLARSTISGAILTLSCQVLPLLALQILWPEHFWVGADSPLLAAMALAYSALMLWAGWRKFSRLELRDAPATSISLPEGWLPSLSRLLRCGKKSVWLNLVRKEVLLLRQLGQFSLIFTAGWLVIVVLWFLLPSRGDLFWVLLNSLNAVFSGIVLVVAGSLAASEERTLGVSAWQLTLPVAARRQWLIKLLTAAATAIGLAYVLPRMLVAITPFEGVGTPATERAFLTLVAIGIIAFVTSFWVASHGANVVQATMATILVLLIASIGGISLVVNVRNQDGFQADLWIGFLSYFQLGPDVLGSLQAWLMLFVAVPPILIALIQSRRQFQRVDIRSGLILWNIVFVSIIALLSALWLTDLLQSERRVAYRLRDELFNALPVVPQVREAMEARGPEHLKVTAEELARTKLISPQVQEWLRNSTLRVNRSRMYAIVSGRRSGLEFGYPQIAIDFPNGSTYYLR